MTGRRGGSGSSRSRLLPEAGIPTVQAGGRPIRIADSTPVEYGRLRDTARRSDLAGWAGYGYCASHSRWFWRLRLHLITTVHGLPVAFALTHPQADERDVLVDCVS